MKYILKYIVKEGSGRGMTGSIWLRKEESGVSLQVPEKMRNFLTSGRI
jgi:hypothetical protein